MRKIGVIIVVCIGLLGCKKGPSEMYEKIVDQHMIYPSLPKAAEKMIEIPELPLSSVITTNLASKDSVVQISEEVIYKSNFHIYQLTLEPDSHYTIHLKSYCDCFGGRKFMFFPQVAVLNQKREHLSLKVLEEKVYEPKWTSPVRLERIFTFYADSVSEHTLFVYANNSILNKELIQSSSSTPIQVDPFTFYIDVPYSVKAYPIGKYEVSVGK